MALLSGGGLFTIDGILEVLKDVEGHFARFWECETGRAAWWGGHPAYIATLPAFTQT
jgi:hypothetical protein